MGALLHFNKAKYYNGSTKIKRKTLDLLLSFKCFLFVF